MLSLRPIQNWTEPVVRKHRYRSWWNNTLIQRTNPTTDSVQKIIILTIQQDIYEPNMQYISWIKSENDLINQYLLKYKSREVKRERRTTSPNSSPDGSSPVSTDTPWLKANRTISSVTSNGGPPQRRSSEGTYASLTLPHFVRIQKQLFS